MKRLLRSFTLLALALAASASARAQEAPLAPKPADAAEPFVVGLGRSRPLAMPSDIAFFSASPVGALRVRVVNSRTLSVVGQVERRAHLVIHLAPRAGSRAQEVRLVHVEVRRPQGAAEAGAREHALSLRVVDTANSPMPVWEVGGLAGLGFRSLDSPSLQEWISALPEGSAIRWAWPSNLPPKWAPRVARELRDFAEFCRSVGVQLDGEPLEANQRLEPRLFWEEDR